MAIWVQVETKERVLATKCRVARSFRERLLGLMGRKSISTDEAMLFPKCSSVHTWFMRTPIDIVFLKKLGPLSYSIVSVHSEVRPWSLLPLVNFKADTTLELARGQARDLRPGQEVACSV